MHTPEDPHSIKDPRQQFSTKYQMRKAAIAQQMTSKMDNVIITIFFMLDEHILDELDGGATGMLD